MAEDGIGSPCIKKEYDVRHRVALWLLTTWLDVKCIKMVINLHSSRIRMQNEMAC
jgi:hypothetical protein